MKITDAFLADHQALYAKFDQLEKTIPSEVKTLAEVRIPGAELAAILAEHAKFEDDLLFAAIEEKMGSDESTKKVRDEHARIEILMQDVLGYLDDIKRMGHARRTLLQAIKVARAHFNREEKETFPLAEEILGEEKLLELGALWEEMRKK
ncbi:MAG: hemerythrin domain-containing protein [Anaerolineales bacterium]|nr:hemerythrin domain-containing protein [Chloroflexota bacterium]MBL6982024.1 hemerythrin domain-containing protein [Anaerolineales bacterium]